MAGSRRPLVVDTDPGIDDALALLYLATCAEWDVRAVTVVAGNVPLDRCVGNALGLVRLLGLEGVPVHPGCGRPLLRPPLTAEEVHGADGLGGAVLPRPAAAADPEHAVDALIRLSRAHAGELEVIALGPLTNLASALILDASVARRVRRLTFMGGAVGRGNVTPCAEFNAYADPDALEVVLDSGIDYTMIALNATEQARFTRDHLRELGEATPITRFASALLESYLRFYERRGHRTGCALHDPLAVAAAADPGWVTLTPGDVTVETTSSLTRGETVFHPATADHPPATPGRVATALARPGFAQHLSSRLAASDQPNQAPAR